MEKSSVTNICYVCITFTQIIVFGNTFSVNVFRRHGAWKLNTPLLTLHAVLSANDSSVLTPQNVDTGSAAWRRSSDPAAFPNVAPERSRSAGLGYCSASASRDEAVTGRGSSPLPDVFMCNYCIKMSEDKPLF